MRFGLRLKVFCALAALGVAMTGSALVLMQRGQHQSSLAVARRSAVVNERTAAAAAADFAAVRQDLLLGAHANLKTKAETRAQLLAELAKAPILTCASDTLDEYCALVGRDPDVVVACVLKPDGSAPLSTWFDPKGGTGGLQAAIAHAHAAGVIATRAEVVQDGTRLGTALIVVSDASATAAETAIGARFDRIASDQRDAFERQRHEVATAVEEEGLANLHQVALVSGGIALGALLLALILAEGLLRPIRRMRDTLLAVSTGHFDRRSTVRSRDELGELSTALDSTVAALEQSMQAMRRLIGDLAGQASQVGDISHGLDATSRELGQQAASASSQAGQAETYANHMAGDVQSVAAGIQQMQGSIQTISTNVESTAAISREAVGLGAEGGTAIGNLDASMLKVGEVVKLIHAIAGKTGSHAGPQTA